jgi:lysyl-tRNA synthetase class 2
MPAQAGPPRYLITSPEYQLKRLLVSGLRRIYSLGKVFRAGEAGPHHNPEFTMLEWYRAFEDWRSVATDVAALSAQLATELHGSPRFVRSGMGIVGFGAAYRSIAAVARAHGARGGPSTCRARHSR